MPRIILQPMPQSADGSLCVGTVDGEPLVYRGRFPFAGDRPLAHADIAEDLIEAVDVVAAKLFGGDWPRPLALAMNTNPRSTQRDRIARSGLPARVLLTLAEARDVSVGPHARAVGYAMLALASVLEANEGTGNAPTALAERVYGDAMRLSRLLHTHRPGESRGPD